VSEIDPMDLATPEQDQRKSIGRLTRLMARSLSIVWQSARTPFLALIGLQLLNALALTLQVFAVQLALTAVLDISGNTGDLWRLVQPVMLLAGLTAVTAVIASVQVGLGRYAAELVVAVMWKQVLRVATRVDLRKFESARFYDRLQRVQATALTRPYQITHGLVATVGSAAASAGLVIAIVLVHTGLLPLLLAGGVPVLLTRRRQSQLELDFLARQTQSMRVRNYLTRVQAGRDEAKEVRAFGLARNFGTRLNTLDADYLVILLSTSGTGRGSVWPAALALPFHWR
jgi:ATP-binding cassette subfamily B protein